MSSSHSWWSWPRRIVVSVVGGTVVLIGCALLFLPGPAFVVIPVGLAILGIEFVWARRWMLRLGRKVGVDVENPLRKRRKLLIVLLSLATILLLARLALPYVVREQINGGLAKMGEYSGRVADVDLALLFGAYTLNDLKLVKRGGEFEKEFADIPTLDLSIQWSALFDGGLVGEVVLHNPVVNLVQGRGASDSQLGRGVNWPEQVRKLFPFRLNRVQIIAGVVTFRAPGIDTGDSLTMSDLEAEIRNLTNVIDRERSAFAEFDSTGRIMGHALARIEGRLDPNEELPTFDFNLRVEEVELVEVNPWLREYLSVDAEAGRFSMYTELAAAEGRFEGYVKPILEDASIFRWDEQEPNALQKVWEGLVGLVATIFENPPEDQVATQIPLSGELQNPDADLLATLVNLARNAFVAAFSHSIEGSISLRDFGRTESAGSGKPDRGGGCGSFDTLVAHEDRAAADETDAGQWCLDGS